MSLKLNLNKINKKNISYLFVGFLIFLLNQPYFVWDLVNLQIIMFIPLIFIFLFYLRKIKDSDLIIGVLFFYLFLYMAVGSNVNGYLYALCFMIFFLVKEKVMINSFDWFKYVFTVSLFLSLIVYFIVVFTPISVPYELIKPLNTLKTIDYANYPFLVSEGPIGTSIFSWRFFGMFDEPGTIGTFCIILLFSDGYNLKSKKNLIIFIAGIFSFSFYFYVSSLFYYMVFSNFKKRLFIGILIASLYIFTFNNSYIYQLVWRRFVVEDGRLVGDNRSTESLDYIYSKFVVSSDLLWGRGADYAEKKGLMGASSYKLFILNYGLVFAIILVAAFSLLAYLKIKNRRYLIIYIFFILGIMYQRPGMLVFPGAFFLLIASVYKFGEQRNISAKMLNNVSKK